MSLVSVKALETLTRRGKQKQTVIRQYLAQYPEVRAGAATGLWISR